MKCQSLLSQKKKKKIEVFSASVFTQHAEYSIKWRFSTTQGRDFFGYIKKKYLYLSRLTQQTTN